eukprot:30897-Pelagococcus_subviridis.AAC.41
MSPATSSLNAEHALREPSAQYQPQCIPSYGARNGTVPRLAAHFSSGGSFPEVHVAQFPPGLDLALLNALDAPDAVLECAPDNVAESHDTQALTKHSKHTTFLPTPHAVCARPTIDDTSAALIKTRASILGKIAKKDMHLKVHAKAQPEFVKYTPSMRRGDTTSEASHRVIKLHEVQSDPLDPPKFRHKKVPRGPGSPPAPIMHSPPRSTNAKEQVDWKVPPSISNWKNPKGYTIPLDKRLAADGRGLQDVHINDNFAKLSEALYLAEEKAREAVETRARLQHELLNKQKQLKEEDLKYLARQARDERPGDETLSKGVSVGLDALVNIHSIENKRREAETERRRRDEIRDARRRERESERRIESCMLTSVQANTNHSEKKSKISRDRERDVGEQIALGQSKVPSSGERIALFDQRLFDQTSAAVSTCIQEGVAGVRKVT